MLRPSDRKATPLIVPGLVHRTVKRHPPASIHRALRESRGQD
jgi:hypothetical protein